MSLTKQDVIVASGAFPQSHDEGLLRQQKACRRAANGYAVFAGLSIIFLFLCLAYTINADGFTAQTTSGEVGKCLTGIFFLLMSLAAVFSLVSLSQEQRYVRELERRGVTMHAIDAANKTVA